MPHQNPHAPNATAQNAATDKDMPNDQAAGQSREDRSDPDAYAARSWQDATLAPPAAGEMADYADEGEPSGGMQQGADRTDRGEDSRQYPQGGKTQAEQRRQMSSGSPDQGTQ